MKIFYFLLLFIFTWHWTSAQELNASYPTLKNESPFFTFSPSQQAGQNFRISSSEQLSLPGTTVRYIWSGDQWVLQDSLLNFYDATGRLQSQNDQGVWYFYSYDTVGHLTQVLEQAQSFDTWIPISKKIYQYNSKEMEVLSESYTYSNGIFVLTSGLQTIPAYDSLGKLISITTEINYGDNSGYAYQDQTVFTYTDTHISAIEYFIWDNDNWTPQSYKINMLPSLSSNPSAYTYSLYDFSAFNEQFFKNGHFIDSLNWILDYPDQFGSYRANISAIVAGQQKVIKKIQRLVDPSGNLLVSSELDLQNGSWQLANLDSISYTFSGNNIATATEWLFSRFSGLPVTRSDSVVYLNYSSFTLDAAQSFSSFDLVKVYPQPGTDFLNISLPSASRAFCRLVDLLGNTLESFVVDFSTTLNISAYPRGIYFLEVNLAGKSFIKKIDIE